MKYILSACPIHRGCTIEVVFADDANEASRSQTPALKSIAEHDLPDLVPIQAEHHRAVPVPPTSKG